MFVDAGKNEQDKLHIKRTTDPTSKRCKLAQTVVELYELTLNTNNRKWKHWLALFV